MTTNNFLYGHFTFTEVSTAFRIIDNFLFFKTFSFMHFLKKYTYPDFFLPLSTVFLFIVDSFIFLVNFVLIFIV